MATCKQGFGVHAVGARVAREFGDGVTYHGTVTSFLKGKGEDPDLYHVEYDDGDAEDMGRDEYNYAYALELEEQGWVIEEGGSESEDSGSDREGNRESWKPSKVTRADTSF